jgi:hypothetical protein
LRQHGDPADNVARGGAGHTRGWRSKGTRSLGIRVNASDRASCSPIAVRTHHGEKLVAAGPPAPNVSGPIGTPTKLARLADITIKSGGSIRPTAAHVHNRKIAAAAIHPTAGPYRHPAVATTAAAAATPTASAAPPRTPIKPSRLNTPATARVKHSPTGRR